MSRNYTKRIVGWLRASWRKQRRFRRGERVLIGGGGLNDWGREATVADKAKSAGTGQIYISDGRTTEGPQPGPFYERSKIRKSLISNISIHAVYGVLKCCSVQAQRGVFAKEQ